MCNIQSEVSTSHVLQNDLSVNQLQQSTLDNTLLNYQGYQVKPLSSAELKKFKLIKNSNDSLSCASSNPYRNIMKNYAEDQSLIPTLSPTDDSNKTLDTYSSDKPQRQTSANYQATKQNSIIRPWLSLVSYTSASELWVFPLDKGSITEVITPFQTLKLRATPAMDEGSRTEVITPFPTLRLRATPAMTAPPTWKNLKKELNKAFTSLNEIKRDRRESESFRMELYNLLLEMHPLVKTNKSVSISKNDCKSLECFITTITGIINKETIERTNINDLRSIKANIQTVLDEVNGYESESRKELKSNQSLTGTLDRSYQSFESVPPPSIPSSIPSSTPNFRPPMSMPTLLLETTRREEYQQYSMPPPITSNRTNSLGAARGAAAREPMESLNSALSSAYKFIKTVNSRDNKLTNEEIIIKSRHWIKTLKETKKKTKDDTNLDYNNILLSLINILTKTPLEKDEDETSLKVVGTLALPRSRSRSIDKGATCTEKTGIDTLIKEIKQFLFLNESQLNPNLDQRTNELSSLIDRALNYNTDTLQVYINSLFEIHDRLGDVSKNNQTSRTPEGACASSTKEDDQSTLDYFYERGRTLQRLIHEERTKHPLTKTDLLIKHENAFIKLKRAYRTKYGYKDLERITFLTEATTQACLNEDEQTLQIIKSLQTEINQLQKMAILFFESNISLLLTNATSQLSDMAQRITSLKKYNRVEKLIKSDKEIMANQLGPNDENELNNVYLSLHGELYDYISMLKMSDINDEQRTDIKRLIKIIVNQIQKIITATESITEHRYKHQIKEMQMSVNCGNRWLQDGASEEEQRRTALIERLDDKNFNLDTLLSMDKEDFDLMYQLLSGNKLSAQNKETMKNNGWQLTGNSNLMTQRGLERVTVITVENSYLLIDTASGVCIGVVDEIRLNRIFARMGKIKCTEGITRQMVIDDYIKYP